MAGERNRGGRSQMTTANKRIWVGMCDACAALSLGERLVVQLQNDSPRAEGPILSGANKIRGWKKHW